MLLGGCSTVPTWLAGSSAGEEADCHFDSVPLCIRITGGKVE